VKKLSVNRNGATHTFDSKRFTVNAPHGPYADELRTEANRLITANPGLCRTQIMTLLHDHTLRVHARRSSANPTSPALSPLHMKYTELLPQEQRSFVLHTLPYECDSQAIEKVWADVKRFVATQNTNTRTPAQVAQHLRWGFYGMSQSELSALLPGTKPPRQNGVSPICHKFVECAEKYLNSWIPSLSLIKSTFPASTPPEGHTLSSIDADWIARYKRKNTLIVTFGNEEEEDDAMDEQDEFAFPDHI